MSLRRIILSVMLAASLFIVAGCTTMESQGTPVSTAQQQLQEKDQELATLMASKAELEQTLAQRNQELQQQEKRAREAQQMALAAKEQAKAARGTHYRDTVHDKRQGDVASQCPSRGVLRARLCPTNL